MSFRIDATEWAQQQFADCQLGDRRRTRRLIQVAKQVANDPSASFPNQMKSWGDLKAAYRLFDCEDVTFEAIAGPHWEQTRAVEPGRYLVLDDTTEIDFGRRRDIPGLSKIGNGSGRGFLLHNGLLVEAENRSVIGVAGQVIHYRKPKPKKESAAQRFKREREARVWGDVVDQVGPPGEGVQLVHVCDRGADDFEVFCRLVQNHCDWVVRASSLQRKISTPGGEKMPLQEYLGGLPLAGVYECRWLVEEYHKALKTGCSVQRRLLRDADRLEAMVGLMSVVSVRPLQLKSVARSDPDRPARNVVPPLWLQMLKAARKRLRRVHDLTIYEFYREVAKLGGFLGRRSDGEPGWITIWRGWEKLNTLVQGAQLAIDLKKCG